MTSPGEQGPEDERDGTQRLADRTVAGLRHEAPALGMLAAIISIAMVWTLHLWDASLRVPLFTGPDATYHLMAVKNILTTGSSTTTSHLGAPFGQNLADFPATVDPLNVLIVRVFGLFSSEPAVVVNAFYFATFFLTGAAAYASSRILGLRRSTAVALGVLYAFVPYHFAKNENHLFLSNFAAAPLVIGLIVLLLRGKPFRLPQWVFLGVTVLVAGLTSIYYAVFALCLLVPLGLLALLRAAPWRTILRRALPLGVATIGIITLLGLQALPTIQYRGDHGTNEELASRTVGESELYGLRISHLILPAPLHRLSAFRDLRAETNASVLSSENSESLGLLGVAGLAVSVVAAFVLASSLRGDRWSHWALRLGDLGTAAIWAILVATVSGLSTVAAVAGFTEVRVWARMSVFIAFAALVAAFIVIERGIDWVTTKSRTGVYGSLLLVAISGLALLDQTSPKWLSDHQAMDRGWESDRSYVEEIESAMPTGAMIFQAPIAAFPEIGPTVAMPDYTQLFGYIHSDELRWSYGAVKGRAGQWLVPLTTMSPDQLVRAAAATGFAGLDVTPSGLADGGAALDAAVRAAGGELVTVSPDGAHRCYDISPIAAALETELGAEGVASFRESLLAPGEL